MQSLSVIPNSYLFGFNWFIFTKVIFSSFSSLPPVVLDPAVPVLMSRYSAFWDCQKSSTKPRINLLLDDCGKLCILTTVCVCAVRVCDVAHVRRPTTTSNSRTHCVSHHHHRWLACVIITSTSQSDVAAPVVVVVVVDVVINVIRGVCTVGQQFEVVELRWRICCRSEYPPGEDDCRISETKGKGVDKEASWVCGAVEKQAQKV